MAKKTENRNMVLVIEDERSLLEVVVAKLEKSGFDAIVSRSVERAFSSPLEETGNGGVTLSSIEQALRHIESLERIDAIWLDHNLLGDEDGLDFVTKFKANGGKWEKIPVFVVSNSADPDLIKAYTGLGVKNYYIKAEHRLDAIIKELAESLRAKKKTK